MNYELRNNIAIVAIDDGKANAVGHAFLDSVNALLDRAEREQAGAVVLRGREGIFSGGFDLKEFTNSDDSGASMVNKGMQLLLRLYSFPLPLVVACTGHGIAMGAFIILACDTRIGVRGSFKITLPETALGMDVPGTMLELTSARILPPFITRAAVQAEVFDPDQALAAGFLDEVVDESEIGARAFAVAEKLSLLPQKAYTANKLATRKKTLAVMEEEFNRMVAQHS